MPGKVCSVVRLKRARDILKGKDTLTKISCERISDVNIRTEWKKCGFLRSKKIFVPKEYSKRADEWSYTKKRVKCHIQADIRNKKRFTPMKGSSIIASITTRKGIDYN